MKAKVHRIVLMVVDLDNLGAEGVADVLENTCISPSVLSAATEEVEWADDHPLNRRDTRYEAFDTLFTKKDAKQVGDYLDQLTKECVALREALADLVEEAGDEPCAIDRTEDWCATHKRTDCRVDVARDLLKHRS